MSEEEKKAIKYFKNRLKDVQTNYTSMYYKVDNLEILLNLIERQQKELDKEKEKNKQIEEINFKVNNNLLELATRLDATETDYQEEKEKNKELEYSLKNNVVTKYCIRHKADDYENKGYIEIAGAMRELLEERN